LTVDDLLTAFTRAAKLLRASTDAAMSLHGVRVGQNLVLEILWANDGATPGEIAARTLVATPTVVNTATRMERAGLLVRRRDSHDARLVRLWLTDHGRALQHVVETERARVSKRATSALTATERRELLNALTKMITRLEADQK
jgi:MarR family transcriptional regulator for hemolysin